MSIGEMENAVGENLSLVFDDMDHTHIVLHHLPAVVVIRDMAPVGDPESRVRVLDRAIVHLKSLNLSRKNLQE